MSYRTSITIVVSAVLFVLLVMYCSIYPDAWLETMVTTITAFTLICAVLAAFVPRGHDIVGVLTMITVVVCYFAPFDYPNSMLFGFAHCILIGVAIGWAWPVFERMVQHEGRSSPEKRAKA